MTADANRAPHQEGKDRMAIERDAGHQLTIGITTLFNRAACPIGFIVLNAEVIPRRIAAIDQTPQ